VVGVLREHAYSEPHPASWIRTSGQIDFAESTEHPLARNAPLNWEGDAQSNVTFSLPLPPTSSWFSGTVVTLALPSGGGLGAAILPLIPCHFHRVTLQVTSVLQRSPVDRPRIGRSTPGSETGRVSQQRGEIGG
jgi:hypothetical protein